MGIPMKTKLSFMNVDKSLKHEVIVIALHMHKKDVTYNLEVKGNTKRFYLNFLIEKDFFFMDAQSLEVFYAVIALAIYGIAIFPNLDDFVDMNAISLPHEEFGSYLLANVYYYLSWRHGKKGGMVVCSSPLLYKGLLTHIQKEGCFV